jgi:hypothetical protein
MLLIMVLKELIDPTEVEPLRNGGIVRKVGGDKVFIVLFRELTS